MSSGGTGFLVTTPSDSLGNDLLMSVPVEDSREKTLISLSREVVLGP